MLARALSLLEQRAAMGRPLQVGLIGAGTFGTMLLSQLARLRGVRIAGVADLSPQRAQVALGRAGIPADAPLVTDDVDVILDLDGLEVVVEATGAAAAGVRHALRALDAGRHVVMVNVEADVLAGPALAARARRAGLVYGLAFGDQPALICDLVDWARACGFEVVCAGKGTKYLPAYPRVTPDDVWKHYGITSQRAQEAGFNPRMFTSFLDGTKSAIEMAAVANATGLAPQDDGLGFPPAGAFRLASVAIPAEDGGVLTRSGTVEVVSSVERDGRPIPDDLRWGIYVTFAAPNDYVAGIFADYGLDTDPTGRYAAMYRPYHLIGLETSVSVLAAGLLGEATGAPRAALGDVCCLAKRDLGVGEVLDGEGGYAVHGALRPVTTSRALDALPIGLAHDARVVRAIGAGEIVRQIDVETPAHPQITALRREAGFIV